MDHCRINDLASNDTFENLYSTIKPITDSYKRKYQKNYCNILDASDIVAVLDDKLMAAYNNYDASKGNFLSFVYIYWKGGISDLLKLKKSGKSDLSMVIQVDINDLSIEDKTDSIECKLADIAVNEILNRLNEKEVVLIKCLVAGESYRSIAQKHSHLFSNYKAVERAVKRIRNKVSCA